jgi:hypothetical protein
MFDLLNLEKQIAIDVKHWCHGYAMRQDGEVFLEKASKKLEAIRMVHPLAKLIATHQPMQTFA